MLNLKIRYKQPDRDQSKLFEMSLVDRGNAFQNASTDFRFAAAVAAFGMILRDSPYKGDIDLATVVRMAQQSRGPDRGGYRREFIDLVQQARAIGRE
jgi:Ca-activated chloride channel family protein